jgi:hypothetical protein
MSRCGTARRRNGRAGRRRRNLVEDGSECQSPSPGDCEVAAERIAGRKTDDSVRFRDGSTRRFKTDPNWHAEVTPIRVRMEAGRIERWRVLPARTKSSASRGRYRSMVTAGRKVKTFLRKTSRWGAGGASRWSAANEVGGWKQTSSQVVAVSLCLPLVGKGKYR